MTFRLAFVTGEYPEVEQRRRDEVINRHAREGIEIDILRCATSAYDGLTPDRLERMTPPFLDAFESARERGYHAAIPFGMYDLAVEGGKSIMPVVGPCEAALHLAATVGQRFGMICYTPDLRPSLRRLIYSYGLGDRMVAFEALGVGIKELGSAAEQVRERLITTVREMIRTHDVDVVVVMGVTMCPVIVPRGELEAEVGVPVVDGISAPIEFAACQWYLGLRPSERRWPRA